MKNILGNHVEGFFCSPTYAGLLEGHPADPEIIETIKSRVKEQVTRLFGSHRPVHVIPPLLDTSGVLPKYECYVWVSSYKALADGDGSHVVLVYWTNHTFTFPEELFENLDWTSIAEDFWY